MRVCFYSSRSEELLDSVVHIETREALDLLREWNGDMSPDSVAATMYVGWLRFMNEAIIGDEPTGGYVFDEQKEDVDALAQRASPSFLFEVLIAGTRAHWCDDVSTAAIVENCEQLALTSLDRAIDEMRLTFGANLREWRWGDLHETYYPHTVFSEIQVLKSLFNRSTSSGGDGYTVNVAASSFTKNEGYRQILGASYRQVIDLDDWASGGFIVNTGQSGNVLSGHYDDLVVPHRQLELLPMGFGDTAVENTRLTLRPAQ